jgi:restriction system protein
MAKRGFFAEMQYQNQQAEKRKKQQLAAQQRQQAAQMRQDDAVQRSVATAQKQNERAHAAEQKRKEKEAAQAHVDSRQAEAEELTDQATRNVAEIEAILSDAMDVDSWIDLEQFRAHAQHPAFSGTHLEIAISPPDPVKPPPEPVMVSVAAPTGLGGMFGGKKKHDQAVKEAEAAHAVAVAQWQVHVANVPTMQLQQMQEHQQAEAERIRQLQEARVVYDVECAEREQQVSSTNAELEALIAGVNAGAKEGVEEYVALVLGTSGYPQSFPVEHAITFDPIMRELEIKVTIPGPDALPTEREFKFNKTKDEITSSSFTQKALKDLYTSGLLQVALRALHEVFEADRAGKIQTISMTVGCNAIDPATGRPEHTNLLAVATDRATYKDIDLANVVPLATLQHLKAVVSKNPFGRVAIDDSRGVRGAL